MEIPFKLASTFEAGGAMRRRFGWLLRPAKIALSALVLLFIGYKISQLGFANIWRNLPVNPGFYAIFALNYLSLPVFELFIYRLLWHAPWRSFPVFLRKRIYNEAVVEYAGEALFYAWATRQCGVGERQAFRDIRDVNILSALAGNLFTLIILTTVLTQSGALLRASDLVLLRNGALLIALLVGVLIALAVVFRGRLIALSAASCAGVIALHVARLLLFMALQASQWHEAIPQIALLQWGLFLALQMGIARIPFLPAKDLVFTGVAISLGGQLSAPTAVVAGMFMAGGALNLLTHLGVYAAGIFQKKAVAT